MKWIQYDSKVLKNELQIAILLFLASNHLIPVEEHRIRYFSNEEVIKWKNN